MPRASAPPSRRTYWAGKPAHHRGHGGTQLEPENIGDLVHGLSLGNQSIPVVAILTAVRRSGCPRRQTMKAMSIQTSALNTSRDRPYGRLKNQGRSRNPSVGWDGGSKAPPERHDGLSWSMFPWLRSFRIRSILESILGNKSRPLLTASNLRLQRSDSRRPR